MLVAVSGGADSVALLRGLLQLREPLQLTLRAAHLNHQLRGADADADADWVEALCRRCDVPCDIEMRRFVHLPNKLDEELKRPLAMRGTTSCEQPRFVARAMLSLSRTRRTIRRRPCCITSCVAPA